MALTTVQQELINIPAASQAEMESASSTTKSVTPGRQQFHPSASKAWAIIDTNGNLPVSYNISSTTDNAAGDMTCNFTNAFSSSLYAAAPGVLADVSGDAPSDVYTAIYRSTATTSIRIQVRIPAGTRVDPNYFSIIVFGDL